MAKKLNEKEEEWERIEKLNKDIQKELIFKYNQGKPWFRKRYLKRTFWVWFQLGLGILSLIVAFILNDSTHLITQLKIILGFFGGYFIAYWLLEGFIFDWEVMTEQSMFYNKISLELLNKATGLNDEDEEIFIPKGGA
jgi:hypothetical protein